MSWLQLDPSSVLERAHQSGRPTKMLSLAESVLRGSVGFTLLSVAGFTPWAGTGRWFYQHVGELGLYLTCAVVFIALSGPLLHRLIIGPGSLARFYALFAATFSIYSALWIAGWMAFGGHLGSVVGLLAGTAGMGWLLARAFAAKKIFWKVALALFVLNSLGYFLGGIVEGHVIRLETFAPLGEPVPKRSQVLIAKLLWGVFYGAGFGAGLGVAFHWLQEQTRKALRDSGSPSPASSEE